MLISTENIVLPYVASVMHSWWYLYLVSIVVIVPMLRQLRSTSASMSFIFRNCGGRNRCSSRKPGLCDCGLKIPYSTCACSAANIAASSFVTGWFPDTTDSRPWMYARCSCTGEFRSSSESVT